ncbi:hypothetical protein B0A48_09810 [Cryoendolithus antarcticus]|uniref:Uncharacterized protein n=1 Tax=Cryoendolithus antarcticus TaxID=1507870 RepID=A0A1V8T2S2_9PEZI|nr:hypothetical protein B0A48_09810 [Cryoendolithus antarcticus]
MHLGLEGKVVLITGGTKGIGRSIVKSFLDEGAIVHFCSRSQDNVKASNDKLAEAYPGNKAIGAAVDVTNAESIKEWVTSCASQSGRIDVIVANVSALATENDPAAWQNGFQTDMMGTVHMVNAALPHLEKTKGNIITISSVSGRIIDFTSQPGPYGPFKAAIIHYTCQLAHVHAAKGIRANTVSPGNIYIEDGVWGNIERRLPDLFKASMAQNPSGRMGKPEEIANVCVFLASDKAGFVTGSNILVDGALSTGVQF